MFLHCGGDRASGYIAADFLAQCEHDPLARGGLVTASESLALKTLEEIKFQLKGRMTQEVVRAPWNTNGIVILVRDLEDAARYANEFASEQMEVRTADPRALLPLLKNYGSLFLGEITAEVYAIRLLAQTIFFLRERQPGIREDLRSEFF